MEKLLYDIQNELRSYGENELAAEAVGLIRIAQSFRHTLQLLSSVFARKGYPVDRLNWFPQSNSSPADPRFSNILEQFLKIPKNSWKSWPQLESLINAKAQIIPDYISFERLQNLRRTQLNPRYRVQQEENTFAGREYKNRAIAATQEIQQMLKGLVFDDNRAINAKNIVETKIKQLIAARDITSGRELARQLSIFLQYLDNIVFRKDFIKDRPEKQRILANNAEIYNKFKALTESLGYRRGSETQRF